MSLAAHSLPRHHGVVKSIVRKTLVAFDSSVAERGVFITAESEYSLIHLLGVEHLEADQEVKVLHRQTGDSQKQIRFQLGNDILKRVAVRATPWIPPRLHDQNVKQG